MKTSCTVLLSLVLATIAVADENADATALGELNEAYVTAFNRQDPQALTQVFTEDGEMLILTGELVNGRDGIAKAHGSFFKNNPQAKLSGKQHQRRFLGPEVAVAHGEWSVTNGPAGYPSKGLWTAVSVRKGGKWRYASLSLMIPVGGK